MVVQGDEKTFFVLQFAKTNFTTAMQWSFSMKFKKPPSRTTIYFLCALTVYISDHQGDIILNALSSFLSPWNCKQVFPVAEVVKVLRHSILSDWERVMAAVFVSEA